MPRRQQAPAELPPNMFIRDGVNYYVRRVVRGREKKISLGFKVGDDWTLIDRKYHAVMSALHEEKEGWNKKRTLLRDYFEQTYFPAYSLRKSHPKRDAQLATVGLADFGDRYLDEFTEDDVSRWANKRRASIVEIKNGIGEVVQKRQIAEGTVHREVSFWQAVFQKAVKSGLIERNPWVDVAREDYDTKKRVISDEEQDKLEAVLSPRYARWFLFMLGTGLRLEEARGIAEASDVDFRNRWVRVTRKTRGLTKKIQAVPLIDPFLLDVLQEQLTEDGQLWHQNQQRFREVLSQAAERAGVDHVSPHTLRHTFATRYLKGGGDIYVLSKILGHSSVAVTEKVYAHLLTDDLLLRSQHVNLGLQRRTATVLPFERKA